MKTFFWLLVCALAVSGERLPIPHLRVYPQGCRYLRAIGKKQCLPSVVVNGQLKAGTTSLFDILKQHPDIIVQEGLWEKSVKEVNSFWFSEAALNSSMYLKRLRRFPLQLINDTRVTMEASPFYFSSMVDLKENLNHFKTVQPNVKIITIVRNPVERSFSEFLMLGDSWRYSSHCNNTLYEDIILEELVYRNKTLLLDDRLHHRCLTKSPKFFMQGRFKRDESDYQGRLVRWSEYSFYLKEWMKVFNNTQMYILKTEDLKNAPNQTVSNLLRWLGVQHIELPVVHHNKASCRFQSKEDCADEHLKKGVNAQTTFSREIGQMLQTHFKPYNDEFAKLTGLNVDDWNAGFRIP